MRYKSQRILSNKLARNRVAFQGRKHRLFAYLCEAIHYQFSHTNRYEDVNKRIRLRKAAEGRDEKGIKKTICAWLIPIECPVYMQVLKVSNST